MSAVESHPNFNVAVLRGVLHRPSQWRELRSGGSVTSFDVKVRAENRNEILRVSWMNAPTTAMEINEGEAVVVSGRVRTYWSGRRSEADVLATSVVRAKSPRQVRKQIATAMVLLQSACP
jgi:hypothetical protein